MTCDAVHIVVHLVTLQSGQDMTDRQRTDSSRPIEFKLLKLRWLIHAID